MTRLKLLIIFVVLSAAIVVGAFLIANSGLLTKKQVSPSQNNQLTVKPQDETKTSERDFKGKVTQMTDNTITLKLTDNQVVEIKYFLANTKVKTVIASVKMDSEIIIKALFDPRNKTWVAQTITIDDSP